MIGDSITSALIQKALTELGSAVTTLNNIANHETAPRLP